MGDDLIRYDLLVQEALRGVVRRVLSNAARDGLPGTHYFHVEFQTAAAGVRLSDRMRERFPDRMTIILQHHFWDLEVTEEALEVGLSFGGVGERVRVPFAAVTGFFDESVQFGLRFEVEEPGARPALAEPQEERPLRAGRAKPEAAKSDAQKSDAQKSDAQKSDVQKSDAAKSETPKGAAAKGDAIKGDSSKGDAIKGDSPKSEAAKGEATKPAGKAKPAAAAPGSPAEAADPSAPSPDETGAKVVSLSAFRKKP